MGLGLLELMNEDEKGWELMMMGIVVVLGMTFTARLLIQPLRVMIWGRDKGGEYTELGTKSRDSNRMTNAI